VRIRWTARSQEAADQTQGQPTQATRAGELLLQGFDLPGLGLGGCQVGKRKLATLLQPQPAGYIRRARKKPRSMTAGSRAADTVINVPSPTKVWNATRS